MPLKAARLVTDYSSDYVVASRTVLDELHRSYTLLLVSNYYGNLKKIVTDLGIVSYFHSITDSTLEGVRKPDPSLWKRAIEKRGQLCYSRIYKKGFGGKRNGKCIFKKYSEGISQWL